MSAAATSSSYPIPLTTIFTPPASCSDVVTYDGSQFWQNGISQTGDPDCFPASFDYIYNSYFTPGICPHAWYSAGVGFHLSGSDAMCCPNGYTFFHTTTTGILANACVSVFTTDLTNVYSTSVLQAGPLPSSHPLSTIHRATITSNTVWADVIQVQWQSSDKEILSLMAEKASSSSAAATSSSTSSTSASPASTTSSLPSQTAPPSTTSTTPIPSSQPSSGLSSGAKAGIGVGVALGVIAAIALIAFLLFRRRRRGTAPEQPQHTEDYKPPEYYQPQGFANNPGYHELAQHDPHPPAAEMDAQSHTEMPGTNLRPELGNENVPHDGRGSLAFSSPAVSPR